MRKTAAVPAPTDAPHRSRDQRFAYWFARISRALSQHLSLHVEANLRLSLAEYRILNSLTYLRSTSIKDIAADAFLDKAQVTRAVAALTARGLAVQVVAGHDRRLRVVKLTPAGRRLIARAVPFVTARQRRLEQALTEAERKALWRALAAIRREAELMLVQERSVGRNRRRPTPSP